MRIYTVYHLSNYCINSQPFLQRLTECNLRFMYKAEVIRTELS